MEPLQTVQTGKKGTWQAVWLGSSGGFAVGTRDSEILFFKRNADGYFLADTLPSAHSKTVRTLSHTVHGGQSYLACGSFDSFVSVWREESDGRWCSVAGLDGHDSEVKCVSWSPESYKEKLLATCGRDKTVWVWLLRDSLPECVGLLAEHTQDVKWVGWRPGAVPALFSCGYDNTVRVWHEVDEEWCSGGIVCSFSTTVWAVSFHSTGKYFVCVTGGVLRFFHEAHGPWEEFAVVEAHTRDAYSVCWSGVLNGDTSYIASCGDDNRIQVCSFDTNREIKLHATIACGSAVTSVQWAEDSLLACLEDGTVKVLGLNTPGRDASIKPK
ncbi:MAG: Cia1-like WD repeat domain-containing protein [Amphiamblys sp. WSBS2006]|nr:MAG: Cia1-like WD repeat domain-containing protein [Amphiamblys sp. WSBS2006]